MVAGALFVSVTMGRMLRSLGDYRSRLYLRVLAALGDRRLRHCDVARNRQGEVVAITFARDLGYIEQIRDIESNAGLASETSERERQLRRRVTILSTALAIVTVGVILEELAERLMS